MNINPQSTFTQKTKEQTKEYTKEHTKEQTGGRSDQVASCLLEESCVIRAPIGKMWEMIKEFNWEKMCPTTIKSCKFLTGNSLQIGSTYKLDLVDGTSYTFMIVEISEIKRKYTLEMIDCEPKQKFTSMLSTLKLRKVTEDLNTVLTWQTDYSNDVTPNIISARRDVVKSYFKDLKKFEQ